MKPQVQGLRFSQGPVQFPPDRDRFSPFFERYGVVVSKTPNAQGWVNFPCPLPTHPHPDRHEHGGFNLFDGRYKCFNDRCKHDAMFRVGKRDTAQVLTAEEFLMVLQNLPRATAQVVLTEYRQEDWYGETHYDDVWTKSFSPLSDELTQFMSQAQGRLSPDLDIVQSYMLARDLTYETLERFGAGYVPESEEEHQPECLVLPYIVDGQVTAIRGRTIDGRKGGVKNSHYCPFNLDAIDNTESRAVVICEGETDTMFVSQSLTELEHSIPVVGTPGADFPLEWKRHLQGFQRIIALPQDDEAAQRKFIPALLAAFGERLEIIKLPWSPKQRGKDVVDFCRTHSPEEIINLMGLERVEIEPLPRILTPEILIREAQKEIPWLIKGLVERGTKTMLAGHPKTYKTWLALQLIQSVVTGAPFLDFWEVVQSNLTALLIEEEGSTIRLGKRVMAVFDGEIPYNFHVIHRQGIRLDDPESFALLKQDIIGLRPDVVIFDPYSALNAMDENTVEGNRTPFESINHLLRIMPWLAIWIIHHWGRAGHIRGSSYIEQTLDQWLEVKRVPASTTLELKITGRDNDEGISHPTQFYFDTKRLRVVPQPTVYSYASKERLGTYNEQRLPGLLQLMNGFPDSNVTTLSDRLNMTKDNMRRLLEFAEEHGHVTSHKVGKENFYKLIEVENNGDEE